MNLAAPALPHAVPRLRRFALRLAAVSVCNVLIAVVLTWVLRVGGDFPVNLVFSLCIGTLALLLIDVPRAALWGENEPPRLAFGCLLLAAALLAYGAGSVLAARLLGLPLQDVFDFGRENAGLFGFTLLACFLASWFFWNRSRIAILQARAEAEKAHAAAVERQAMQAQLQLLQAQIEPHMLFNTLANLQGLIALDPERAQLLLEQLIQYLRATLSSARAESTTLGQEFALMEAYLGLMAVRMGKRLSYTLSLPEDLRALRLPPMLLQPLVENAVKHGLEPKIEGGHIDISAVREAGGGIRLAVADTGLGLDVPAAAGGRVGLANVRERLQALYGAGAGLSLLPNHPAGALARLTLPVQP